jgi:hypothetical protein
MLSRIPRIFLSYASEDFERASDLYYRLHGAGFSPWMDKRDIVPGERWERSIWNAVRRSDFVVILLSRSSVTKRGFLQKEIREALKIWEEKLEDDIYLIPVRLDECEVPERLREFEWVDLFDEIGWYNLLNSISVGVDRLGQPLTYQTLTGELRVRAEHIEESKLDIPRYKVSVSYPVVEGLDERAGSEINTRIHGYVLGLIQEFRKAGIRREGPEGSWWSEMASEMAVSYEVAHFNTNFLSLAFVVSEYGAGAAHSQERTVTFNYILNPATVVDLSDIFTPESDVSHLEFISGYCIEALADQFRRELSDLGDIEQEWIRNGAGPDINNFRSFNFTAEGISLQFDPYQVAGYAWGIREVKVPYSAIREIINWRSPIISAIREGSETPH